MSRFIRFALTTAGLACAAHTAAAKDQPNHAPGPFVAVDGAPAGGTLATKKDKDFFRFKALEGVSYLLYTSPAAPASSETDTILRLYNGNLTSIASNDDSSLGSSSLIEWTAPKSGTYHLRVTGYTGDVGPYRLWVSTTEGTNPAPLPVTVAAPPLQVEISNPLQVQTFAFGALPGWHYVVRVESPDEPNLKLEVLGQTGVPVSTGVFSESEVGVQTAGAAVVAASNLQIRVSPNFQSADLPATFTLTLEGAESDDHPGEWPGTPFSASGPRTGWLPDATDVDAFQFTAIAGLPYDILTHGPGDTVLEIVDSNGVVVASDDDGGAGLLAAVRGFVSSATATYLARVRLGSGAAVGFGLGIVDVATDDYGGAAASASALATDGSPTAGIIACAEDSDWFAVYVNAGQSYQVGTSGVFDTILRIVGPDGASLLAFADDTPGSSLAALEWTAPFSGFVYVAVDGFFSASGPYSVWIY